MSSSYATPLQVATEPSKRKLVLDILTRVSTEMQSEEGTSPETQIETCIAEIRRRDAVLGEIQREDGVSGASIVRRAGLHRSIQRVREGAINGIVCMKMDRFARSVKAGELFFDEIERAGGVVIFADGMNFGQNAAGKFARTVMGGVSELERLSIIERTTAGRRKKAEQGIQPSRCLAPYGYYVVQKADVLRGKYPEELLGHYIVIEEQARWVREIFSRYAAGWSLYKIAAWLQVEGVPTPSQALAEEGRYFAKHKLANVSECWWVSTISALVRRPIYKGSAGYGISQRMTDESRISKGKQPHYFKKRNPEEQIDIPCPAIVTEEIWNICKQRGGNNQKFLGGNPKNRRILASLVRCVRCARVCICKLCRNEDYYCCSEGSGSARSDGVVCNPVYHRASEINQLVIDSVMTLAREPARMVDAIAAFDAHLRQAQPQGTDMESLRRELASAKQAEEVAVTAQIEGITLGVDPSVYVKRLKDAADRRSKLQERLERADRAAHRTDGDSDADQYQQALSAVAEVLTSPEMAEGEKNQILRTVIESVIPDIPENYVKRARGANRAPLSLSIQLREQAGTIHCMTVRCIVGGPLGVIVTERR